MRVVWIMPMAFQRYLPWWVIFALALAAFPCEAGAQEQDLRQQFERLIQQGERMEIPWKVSLRAPQLRLDQRLGSEVLVSISGSDLKRLRDRHDLLLMVRIAPQGADWLPGFEWLSIPVEKPLAGGTSIEFHVSFVARPGDFRVGIVLLDRLRGQSSATVRPLRVAPLSGDPLPQAFHNLPPAEFVSATEGFEAAFLTRMKGRLWLPVESPRKLRVEILTNLSPSEAFNLGRRGPSPLFRGRRGRRLPTAEDNLFSTLAALKPLSEFVSQDGILVTALDVLRRRVVFEHAPSAAPDWSSLEQAVTQFKSNVVSADMLRGQRESAAFFRDLLRQRLQQDSAAPGQTQASATEAPLRVFIILSGAMVFPEGTDLAPMTPVPTCNCRVYFIRLQLFGNYWDELDSLLRPLRPRRFDVRSPADYRRAIAAILSDLRTP